MSTKAVTPVTPVHKPETIHKPETQATAFVPTATTAATARAGRKLVNKNETPEQTFKRLCEPRVTKMLRQAKTIKNLARFKPSEKYREKVFTAIREAVNLAETAWKGNETMDAGFQL